MKYKKIVDQPNLVRIDDPNLAPAILSINSTESINEEREKLRQFKQQQSEMQAMRSDMDDMKKMLQILIEKSSNG